jgi:hypothetical protein
MKNENPTTDTHTNSDIHFQYLIFNILLSDFEKKFYCTPIALLRPSPLTSTAVAPSDLFVPFILRVL